MIELSMFQQRVNRTLTKANQEELTAPEVAIVDDAHQQEFTVMDAARKIVRLRSEVMA